jgi:hydrogenase expression/formation protein HypC
MCLGVPGQIVELVDPDNQIAKVDVSGVRRDVNVTLLGPEPEVRVGEWVLIHVGFALSRIDEDEAKATLELLEQLGDLYEQELADLRTSSIG